MSGSVLVYIHGFNSSPKSFKAALMQQYCRQQRPDIHVVVPQLPCFPQLAAERLRLLLDELSMRYQTVGLVGSSLGGYFSLYLNHLYGCKAVVINPAVKPYELLVDYLGNQLNPYTNVQYLLEPKHIDELKALDVTTSIPQGAFWLLQQTGDEVLDYRQAVSRFEHCQSTVEEGGDHSFVGFERYPEKIIQFLGL